jgi:hypothetical protein
VLRLSRCSCGSAPKTRGTSPVCTQLVDQGPSTSTETQDGEIGFAGAGHDRSVELRHVRIRASAPNPSSDPSTTSSFWLDFPKSSHSSTVTNPVRSRGASLRSDVSMLPRRFEGFGRTNPPLADLCSARELGPEHQDRVLTGLGSYRATLNRYERRTRSRRKFAIRRFDAALKEPVMTFRAQPRALVPA